MNYSDPRSALPDGVESVPGTPPRRAAESGGVRHARAATRPTLVLPCETRIREFDAKLLLACYAAERGYRVIVGSKKEIDLDAATFPRGIYVAKSLTKRSLSNLRLWRRLGHATVAWDEEGLVYASPELYRRTKVSLDTLNTPKHLFAWGEANAQAWRDCPGFAGGQIHLTGNPRADLLRPELRDYFAEEAEALKAQYGEFLLINTNFSRINHFYAAESHLRRLLEDGGGRIESEDDPRLGLARHKMALFERFLAMVPALARRFPETTVVVRPHPSESPDAWREAARDCPNVEVVHRGNAVAWLMAARATIHNGCTTAVESFLLERPALAYRPVVAEEYDHPLPNGLSLQCFDDESLFARAAARLSGDDPEARALLADRAAYAARHIASYRGKAACERILDVLDGIVGRGEDTEPTGLADRAAAFWQYLGRGLQKRIERRLPGHRNHPRYLRHMFPPIDADAVNTLIARFGARVDRFAGVRATPLDENVFEVKES